MPQATTGYRRRNSLRYNGYDYTLPGSYAITICAYHGRCIFGRVVDQEMTLNPIGQIADQCCQDFGERHERIELNTYIIMPNHVHILFTIIKHLSMTNKEHIGKKREFGQAIAGSVSSYIGGYKGSVTQLAKNRGLIAAPPLWQGKFYDRIVRDEKEFQRHYDYIQSNPARWLEDQLHPQAPPNKFNASWTNP